MGLEGKSHRETDFNFLEHDALSLPDSWANQFDLVTCQTLLMHVVDPLACLHEMARCVRPRGVVMCAEPNNLYNWTAFNHSALQEDPCEVSRRVEFWLRVRRGRIAAGKGDMAVGESLHVLMQEAGLLRIQAQLSDRMILMAPPYASNSERLQICDMESLAKSGIRWILEDDIIELCIAGGASAAWAEQQYNSEEVRIRDAILQVKNGTYIDSGAGLLMIYAGTKSWSS